MEHADKILDKYWNGTLQINSKQLMYWLMQRGLLGNTFRIFDSEKELFNSDITVCGIRSVGRPGLPCVPWIEPEKAFGIAEKISREYGCKVIVCECDKFLDKSIQGDLQIYDDKLDFYYTYEKCYMRQALRDGGHMTHGWKADALLRAYLNPPSYQDIKELLERFPKHVIEFTAYKECVGSCTGRNYVVWEIRNY